MADEKNDVLLLPPSRRRFIATMLTVISGTIASILGVPLAGFFALPALRRPERRWLEVGPVSDFAQGEIKKVLAKPLTAQVWPYEIPPMAIFVQNQGGGSFALYYIHCTHVGCPVRWSSQAGRFFSPCHGGVFDKEGRVLAGPPPRPLDRYEYKIEKGVLYAGRIYEVNEKLEFTRWYQA
ncbi:MAG: ubiquinol-cytochrome c reductase iron-sulfur subunit [bacterium]|nr:ubiquinol-cytochrome c reductase iron-sulfur subunit [bacterium]